MRMCFVSYEIFPTVGGGVGSLIHDLLMGRPDEYEVVLLLDMDPALFERFRNIDRLVFPHSDRISAYLASDLARSAQLDRAEFGSEFEFRSARFAAAVRKLCSFTEINYLEFVDYCGAAWSTLADRLVKPSLYPELIAIRLHNTLEIIDERTYGRLKSVNAQAYWLEQIALPLADVIVAPGRKFFRDEYAVRYNLFHQAMVLATPACRVSFSKGPPSPPARRRILFYGRQSRLKGLDLFLAAAVQLLRDYDIPDVHFAIVGPEDTVTDTKVALSQYVPTDLLANFEMIGPIGRSELPALVHGCACGVFPSRTESYCYALHEVYQLGLPVILNDIPAFRDHFDENAPALFFNGRVADLAYQLRRVLFDPDLRHRLGQRSPALLDRYTGTPLDSFIDCARAGKASKHVRHTSSITNCVVHTSSWDGPATTTKEIGEVQWRTVHLTPGAGCAGEIELFCKRWRVGSGRGAIGDLSVSSDVVVLSVDAAFSASAIRIVAEIASRSLGANVVMMTTLGHSLRGGIPDIVGWDRSLHHERQSEIEFVAFWNWSPLCLLDVSGLLKTAAPDSLFRDLSRSNRITPVVLPGDVVGTWREASMSPPARYVPQHISKGQDCHAIRLSSDRFDLHISIGSLGEDVLTSIWRAAEETARDRTLFFLINPGSNLDGHTANEVRLVGSFSGAQTVVCDGHIFGIEGQIEEIMANDETPLGHVLIKHGLAYTHLWDGDVVRVLGNRQSGNALVVWRGRVSTIRLYRDRLDVVRICSASVDGDVLSVEDTLIWHSSLSYRAVVQFSLGTISWGSRGSRAGDFGRAVRAFGEVEAVTQHLRVLDGDGATDVEISISFPFAAKLLTHLAEAAFKFRPRVQLTRFDFWGCTAEEQADLQALISSYTAWKDTCDLVVSSRQLKDYLLRQGLSASIYKAPASPMVRTLVMKPSVCSLLVLAVPQRIGSIAHMLGAASLLKSRGSAVSVKVAVAESGTATWNPEFLRGIPVSALPLHDVLAEHDFDAVICCYPYAALPDVSLELHARGFTMIVGQAAAINLCGGRVIAVRRWEDPNEIADAVQNALIGEADEL